MEYQGWIVDLEEQWHGDSAMPNRLLREGFLDSEAIDKLSADAECFYHRLILVADDAGRADGRPEILRSRLFPLRDSLRARTIAGWIRECVASRLVIEYEHQAKKFLQVTKWQRCGSSANSKYPWSDGDFVIAYVTLRTRDGDKEFVTTSIWPDDGVVTPSIRGPTRDERPSPSPSPSPSLNSSEKGDARGENIPAALDCAQFHVVWANWVAHRSEIRKPLKPTQEKSQLAMLEKMGLERAIAMIEHTIAMGWQGLREPDAGRNGTVPAVTRKVPKFRLPTPDDPRDRIE